MLSDEDKAKIRDEETYRLKVRDELTRRDSPSPQNRFWAVANKPITIWFLATIIVGVVSWSFDYVNQVRELSTKEKKLDLEISSRLINARVFYIPDSYLVSHISHLQFSNLQSPEEFEQIVRRNGLKSLVPESHGAFNLFRSALDSGSPYGAFPEYKQKSLSSLIWELATLRENSPIGELKTAFDAAIELKLKEIFWQNRNNFENAEIGTLKKIQKEHNKIESQYNSLNLDRWSLGYTFDEFEFDPSLSQPDLAQPE